MKTAISVIALACALQGCSDANVVSRNISKAADQFEISRRIVFYNGITGEYMLEITGLCSIGNDDKSRERSITCKVGPNQYKKHYLGLSDNVTFFAEQIEATPTDLYQYRVVFKPLAIVPNVEIRK